jgi:TonB family protein
LGAWLERHKHYPEEARECGEEGRAVLKFTVDRSGRVLDFAVIRSSGYPDLDTALESMMRGASLPPFPADMRQSSIEVSVAIRSASSTDVGHKFRVGRESSAATPEARSVGHRSGSCSSRGDNGAATTGAAIMPLLATRSRAYGSNLNPF